MVLFVCRAQGSYRIDAVPVLPVYHHLFLTFACNSGERANHFFALAKTTTPLRMSLSCSNSLNRLAWWCCKPSLLLTPALIARLRNTSFLAVQQGALAAAHCYFDKAQLLMSCSEVKLLRGIL